MTKDEKEILTGFLMQGITSTGFPLCSGEIEFKIDLLERALEVLRYEYKHLNNELPFEAFVSGKITLKNGRLNFVAPEQDIFGVGTGTSAVRLQPKLLMFLLLYHSNFYKIYDIIEKFIEKIWDELSVADFKRTQTGVTRCFTNTRFAATTLREYGFLKYTNKEAFKTWTLSLPGFLVASKVLESKNWKLPEYDKQDGMDLHLDIQKAWGSLKDYDEFILRLSALCEPNVAIFESFKPVLSKAYSMLNDYWKILQDDNFSQSERKKESMRRLKILDEEPSMERFYNEFTMSIKDSFETPWDKVVDSDASRCS